MEVVFKKLDEEKIPEIHKKIKPSKFNQNLNNEITEEDYVGKDIKNNKDNIFSQKTIKEKKEICSDFLKKYKFLEYQESFDIESINIDGIIYFFSIKF